MTHLVEISDLAEMLAQRIDALCVHLLPNGKRERNEYLVGSVAGEPGRSMSVCLRGARQGLWKDFSSDADSGDALDLVAAVLFRNDKGEAVKWSRSWLGLDTLDPNRLEQRRRQAKAAADERDKKAHAEMMKIRGDAKRIWHGAQADILASPVHHYFMGRAIDMRRLERIPGAIRFSPSCWCAETNTRLPAMVSQIQTLEEGHISTHRTYLQRFPDGSWKKAKLEEPKKTLSSFRGGFIALNRGASGKPIKEAPPGDLVIIAEGIETGLSIAVEMPEARVLAGVSVTNFQNLVLPPAITRVTIAADNDGDNEKSAAAVDRAAQRFVDQGREVKIIYPPSGNDFNDYLQQMAQGRQDDMRRMV